MVLVTRSAALAHALIAAVAAQAPRTIVQWQQRLAPRSASRGASGPRPAVDPAPPGDTAVEPALVLLAEEATATDDACLALLVEAWASRGMPVIVLQQAPTPHERTALRAAGAAGVWTLPQDAPGWAQCARLLDRCADLSPRARRRLAATPD